MRRLAARVHLWGGLVAGPFLLVLGLSGSVLVLGPDIEGALVYAVVGLALPVLSITGFLISTRRRGS